MSISVMRVSTLVGCLLIAVCCASAIGAVGRDQAPLASIAEAVELLNAGKPRQAAAKLDPLLSTRDDGARAAARFYAGHCLARLKQYDEAANMWLSIDKPSRFRPATAHWHYAGRIEAMRLAAKGHVKVPPAQILEWLEQVLNDPPLAAIQAEAALLLGRLATREGRPDLAKQYYRQGVAFLEDLPILHGHAKLVEPRPALLAKLNKALGKQQARAARHAAAEQAARAEAARPAALQLAEQMIEQAHAAAEGGDYSSAVRELRRAIRLAPNHPHAEQWRYRIGTYLLNAEEWRSALRHWRRFIHSDPTGRYRAQAMLDMADHELFERFDVEAAQTQLARIESTIDQLLKAAAVKATTAPAAGLPSESRQPKASPAPEDHWQTATAGETHASPPDLSLLTQKQFDALPPSWRQAYRSLLQRRGMLVWIQGDIERAAALFEASAEFAKAEAKDFHDRRFADGPRHQRIVERLREGHTPPDARAPLPKNNPRSPGVKTALLLGELAMAAKDWERARTIFDAVVEEKGIQGPPTPEQEAYALLRAARCSRWLNQPRKVREYHVRVTSNHRTRDTSAAVEAFFAEAVLTYSERDQPERALAMMERIVNRFPDTPEAQNAAFCIGLIYEWADEREMAISSYLLALRTYPHHQGMRTAVTNRLEGLGAVLPPMLRESDNGEAP